MADLTKSQRTHLRELAGRGYECALGKELDGLFEKFERWKDGAIDVWDLNDEIHKHHNGPSRDLYKFFMHGDNAWQIYWCINHGFLTKDDVRPDCLPYIERLFERHDADMENEG